ARNIVLCKCHRVFSHILGTPAGGLGLAFECTDGTVRRRDKAVEGLPRLLDACFGQCSHFRGNFESIGSGHVCLLLSGVDCVTRERCDLLTLITPEPSNGSGCERRDCGQQRVPAPLCGASALPRSLERWSCSEFMCCMRYCALAAPIEQRS